MIWGGYCYNTKNQEIKIMANNQIILWWRYLKKVLCPYDVTVDDDVLYVLKYDIKREKFVVDKGSVVLSSIRSMGDLSRCILPVT